MPFRNYPKVLMRHENKPQYNVLNISSLHLYFCSQYPIKLGMRNKTNVPAATFKALFGEFITHQLLYPDFRYSGWDDEVSGWKSIRRSKRSALQRLIGRGCPRR